MNKYKLIAIDIDGTLLNSKRMLPLETKHDIVSAYNKGVKICICTGRSYPAAKPYINELNLDIPLILYNGCRIRMSFDDRILYEETIPCEISKEVYDLINSHNGTCCFWKNDKLYFNKNDKYTVYYENITSIKPTIVNEASEELLSNITKFIWFGEPEELVHVQKEILSKVSGINFFKSQTHILEIVPKSVSKGMTLKVLVDTLGIKQSEVIAIGDDENDISMIEYAGLGVAMGNANALVKNIANYITSTNDENGVGEVIRKFIFK